MKILELRACPSCHGAGVSPLVLRSGSAAHTLHRCTACGLVYAPEYADPTEIYVEGYLTGATEFGLDITHPFFQEFLIHAGHRRMAQIERVTGAKGSILDVGCGSGEVLAAARSRGWQPVGVEPVEQSVKMAIERGLDVHEGMLEESSLPQRSFDVVTAFHVLEHMTDGTSFLESIARWARPGGYVVVEVPNFGSVHRRESGANWPGIRPLEHVAHYTPSTLAATLKRAGLDHVKVHTIGFLWNKQTLDQRLADLALMRLRPYLARVARPSQIPGNPGLVPGRLGAAVLTATESVYDRFKIGPAALGFGRVPVDT